MTTQRGAITGAASPYDTPGCWHHMTPFTVGQLEATRRDPAQLSVMVADAYRQGRFLKYLQEGGEEAFGDATDKAGRPVKVAKFVDDQGVTHEIELKTGLVPDPVSYGSAAQSDPEDNKGVPCGGAQGSFLATSQGSLTFTVQRVEDVTGLAGSITTAAGFLDLVLVRALTAKLNALQGPADSAMTLEALTESSDGLAQAAAQTLVDVKGVLKVAGWVGSGATVLGVLALLVQLFFAIFHKMTGTLSVWNNTSQDFECKVTYLNSGSTVINPDGKPLLAGYQRFPAKNTVQDGLDPLGGGLTYDTVSSLDLVFANGAENAIVADVGIQACVSIRRAGETDPCCSVLIDMPLLGKNGMLLSDRGGGKEFYDGKLSSFQRQLTVPDHSFESRGSRLTVSLCTDQIEEKTTYAGIDGFNYNLLMHIEEARA